ncbi:hypothetical protein SY83_14935 [Paenibacillus swuensis]|uniref:Uncharacterized protein n=1 Tax=Paenibacillus swuensis TaxID=1178515 RepID=A0A172TJW2_9BACL|nr:hypothetical protein [Paenibacillus swuensis]ANE47349.1 hypothetical protein SY83_14935 [Paenibacillus swuensis]
MHKRTRLITAACMATIFLFSRTDYVYTEPVTIPEMEAHQQQLLEKSLTLVELDREISRISKLRESTEEELRLIHKEVKEHEAGLQAQHSKMSALLNSMYQGERLQLWSLLLSTRSWKDALSLLDTVQLLMEGDRILLDQYTADARNLSAKKEMVMSRQALLKQSEENLQAQREHWTSLQQEVNEALTESGDAAALKQLIDDMSRYWLTSGQELFQSYFKAMAQAMKDFPELLKQSNQELSLDGLQYTVMVTDDDLNSFLRQKNPLFQDIRFTFVKDQVIAEGTKDDMKVKIAGYYTVQQKPKNVIKFHLNELEFNGLQLPETTSRAFEERFDLGFYPQKIMAVFKAERIIIEDDKLIVSLKMGL